MGSAVKPAPQAMVASTIAGTELPTTVMIASATTTAPMQPTSAARGRRSVTAPTAATPATPAAP